MICLPKGSRKRLSDNFNSYEFDCNCHRCKTTIIDEDLITKLQALRNDLGKTITVLSGYRCPAHNKEVGGAPKSQHMLGKAADIVCRGLSPEEVSHRCELFGGIGVYPRMGFTHVDVRKKKSRWTKP